MRGTFSCHYLDLNIWGRRGWPKFILRHFQIYAVVNNISFKTSVKWKRPLSVLKSECCKLCFVSTEWRKSLFFYDSCKNGRRKFARQLCNTPPVPLFGTDLFLRRAVQNKRIAELGSTEIKCLERLRYGLGLCNLLCNNKCRKIFTSIIGLVLHNLPVSIISANRIAP